ncbi:sensor histidine kinase [Polaribacter reichenbachii]|uniref:histidine kinase n=1 Tax=Polaribacter reichenbachii TaxID=996801 RepID=A0A1B8U1N2_9FLAO|nr:sensor histidine kinase [Polaribacter reichenbachii]APZ47257.1 sensor histidine kinase [Polaribacter reichenbachii]AUC17898.1 sensor histidine kinase [Polaribacter reichenbachii]OBY65778.1 hypothetical protein LPB301_08155 [Polaribacter reichenbachii]
MNIKRWIIIIINTLNICVVLFLSVTFYKEFSKVLDNRVLLQLNSIKTLKHIQLQKLINSEWQKINTAKTAQYNSPSFILPATKFDKKGIYDVTHLNPTKETSIVFINFIDGVRKIHLLDYNKVKNILLERTGMGVSGESYLVADDFRLRSQSRFYPKKIPYHIKAKTKGVLKGIKGNFNSGIFLDYRNISVYSAYQPINIGNLNWVILSEIDVDEVSKPLIAMRKKLIFITICIIVVSVFLSLFLTKIITQPIIEMKKRLMIMAKGNYNQNFEVNLESSKSLLAKPKEINEMFEALTSLKTALSGAVDFSVEVGNMNLTSDYSPKSTDDLLGKTLLKMREKLIDFRNKEQQLILNNKRLLVVRLEDERKKLARELHDGIGPFLTTLKFYIQNNIEKESHKKEIKSMIDTTIAEVRSMTNALMPSTLEDFGIGPTLKNYVETIQQSVAIKIEFDDASKGNISNELAINLFRIVQELINNTIKHSKANQIKITLSEFENFISLFYFDDGGGFNLEKINLGSGINNIRERVEIFNGTLDLNTENGTTIFEIEIPI